MGRAIVRAGQGVPVRRAAVEPRRQAARPDAHRDRPPAAPARHHDRLRHPRPDRGDDARRPGRGAEAGVLQQLASPRELYEQPVNLFVAGFIGSPPMNFLPATVAGDKVELPFGTVDLPEHARRQGARGQAADRRHPTRALRGRLRRREPTSWPTRRDVPGHRRRRRVAGQRGLRLHPLRGAAGGRRRSWPSWRRSSTARRCAPSSIVSLGSASRVRGGDEAELFVDTRKMHLFDPGSGENLDVEGRRPIHAR